MCNILCHKLGFDAGNAAEFEYEGIIQSAIYLFIFRNHFVSKFVYS